MKVTNKKISGVNYSAREFSSLQEVTSYISSTKLLTMFSNKKGGPASEKTNSSHDKWAGTSSLNEALNLLKTGWTDKSKEIEEKLGKKYSMEQKQAIRQKSVYDVVGGNASVPRYLQGVPTNMIRQVRTPVKEKVVTINYNIGYNSGVSAAVITERAINCLSYIKNLEDLGTRVNLNLFWMTHNSQDYVSFIVPVKKSSERISVSKLSFCLCHPSMLRRIMFALIERESSLKSMAHGADFVYGYGYSVSQIGMKAEEKKVLEAVMADKNMILYKD